VSTSIDVKPGPSSTVLREFDLVQPHGGSMPTRRDADTAAGKAELLHVSPAGAQRSLDEIERDFMNCLCAAESGHA
jgi:hypothetical protein